MNGIAVEGSKMAANILAEKMVTVANNNNNVSDVDGKLPVVELKPFITSTKKEWRPANSWVDAFEIDAFFPPAIPCNNNIITGTPQSNVVTSTNNNNQSASRSNNNKTQAQQETTQYYEQLGYPHPQRLTPRVPDGICAKAFPVTGERQAPHPRQKDIPEGSGSNRESFVPKLEREKSTAEVVGMNATLAHEQQQQRTYTEIEEMTSQRSLKVSGKQYRDMPKKRAKIYYEPWQIYKMNRAKPDPNAESAAIFSRMQVRAQALQSAYLDEYIYDYFDRTVALPSISVTSAGQKRHQNTRRTKSMYTKRPSHSDQCPASPAPTRRSSSSTGQRGYRLGVVNSLDVLSLCEIGRASCRERV